MLLLLFICLECFPILPPLPQLFFWKLQPRNPAEAPGGFKNINQFRSWRLRLSSGKTFYIKQIVLCPCRGRQRFKLNMQQAPVGCLPPRPGRGKGDCVPTSLTHSVVLFFFFFSFLSSHFCYCRRRLQSWLCVSL